MRPLPGMVTVAEYPTRFDADVGAARLAEAGFESTVLGDPAHAVAPHHVTERSFRLLVRAEVADHAATVLGLDGPDDPEADALDRHYHSRRFADRPAWIRWGTWALLLAVPGPIVVAALFLVLEGLGNLFPG